ncbi:DUF1801 domain-containing protein [Neobacillus dielmonensis]|uniref:DUF1801 domain-containing protein n=1 Tax=Neobacillus dielmonensis TaxID=1347369 RepID=UPI0005A6E22C|nr:DUF1801 domain-containing protein [Neobacillus dielmonensis]
MTNKLRTNEKVDQLIANFPEQTHNIVDSLRTIILDSSPKLIEELKWNMPNYSYNGLVCYIQAAKNHVNLGFFRGTEILDQDPNKLLQGSAKLMRHIKIKKLEDIQPKTFASLIQEAVALNEKEE